MPANARDLDVAAKLLVGATRVATFVAAFSSHFWTGKSIAWVELNGRPTVTLSESGVVTTALTLTASEGGIRRLLWIMSPAKLQHITIGEG